MQSSELSEKLETAESTSRAGALSFAVLSDFPRLKPLLCGSIAFHCMGFACLFCLSRSLHDLPPRQFVSILLVADAPEPIVSLSTAGAKAGTAFSCEAKDKVPPKSRIGVFSQELERANKKMSSTSTKVHISSSAPVRDALRSLKPAIKMEKMSDPISPTTERTAELIATSEASREVGATPGGGAAAAGSSGTSEEPLGVAAGAAGFDLAKGSGRGAAGDGEQLVSDYLALVWKLIKKNWHPVQTTSTHTCTVKFRIKPNGTIENVRLVRSSGADDSDQAAISAVRASSPLPPVPEGVIEDIDIKFDFDYTVLKHD